LAKLEQRTSNHILVEVDPAIKHEEELNAMLTDLASTESKVKEKHSFVLRRTDLLKFLTSEAPSPWNHGLIKLHKDGFPLRDISDASQSPGHKLAKAILPLFSGYTGQSEHHLSSHSQLIDILRSGRFNGGFFASCDAVDIYPSIIIADALQLLEEKMANDTKWAWKTDLSRNEILGLVKLLICNPYFQCELGFFQQAKGTPMGGPLSRLLADLLIENKIEAKIKADRKWKKSFNWVHLIDDTFMNWKDSEEKLEEFSPISILSILPSNGQWKKKQMMAGSIFLTHNSSELVTMLKRLYTENLRHQTGTSISRRNRLGTKKLQLFTLSH